MIKKLKIRFITLAMASLIVLLAVIVAGMNIINYRTVVRDADARLDVLEENAARLIDAESGMPRPFGKDFDDGPAGSPDKGDDGPFFGRNGRGGPSMTRDEAEESRFFIVTTDSDGRVLQTNLERIYSIDSDSAGEMAEKAIASGKDNGFVDDFRFDVSDSGTGSTVTFLDCGRVLDSYRDFLRASIMMSVLGLAAVFGVICFFAERIVRPVAESYEKQKRFVTDAGHEIKTPLAIIKANLDLIDMELERQGAGPDELKEDLKEIDDQVDRLTDLTNDLVYLSRMEEAGNSPVMTEVPLSDIVSEAARSFEPLAGEQGKAIETAIETGISVQGSSKELEKLLSIILENAVKYSTPSAIDVSLRREGRDAVIEVGNKTESELTDEMLAHVFDRFYRTDSSRNSDTGGHGIGLSMARAIVSAHGGRISARTSDGHDFIVKAAIPALR